MATTTIKANRTYILDQVYADGSKPPSDYELGISLEVNSGGAGLPASYATLLTVKASPARAFQVVCGRTNVFAYRYAISVAEWSSWVTA